MTAGRRSGATALVVVVLCGLTLLLGYANKARCAGPEFTDEGRSFPGYDIRIGRDVCYSDIQHLWVPRNLGDHHVPYLSGGITEGGELYGGTVEYPVLSGILIWVGALGADTDAGFLLISALLMAPFGLATAWMLAAWSRRCCSGSGSRSSCTRRRSCCRWPPSCSPPGRGATTWPAR